MKEVTPIPTHLEIKAMTGYIYVVVKLEEQNK